MPGIHSWTFFAGNWVWLRRIPPAVPSAAASQVDVPRTKETVCVTWIGHSNFLIQHHGLNILTDPIFGDCQPLEIASRRRALPPGIQLENLPPIQPFALRSSGRTFRSRSRGGRAPLGPGKAFALVPRPRFEPLPGAFLVEDCAASRKCRDPLCTSPTCIGTQS
jgi:hypothetical protein